MVACLSSQACDCWSQSCVGRAVGWQPAQGAEALLRSHTSHPERAACLHYLFSAV
jgi:hypothetical protein